MADQSARLRRLFSRRRLIRIVGAHDALGARLAERAGFDGVWSSGFEISTSHGVPDANILTMSEYLAVAGSMADAVGIPIVADCDTGYGNSNNVIHMVRKFEAAGVAAVCIEDKLFPKVNSFVPGRQDLASVAEFVGKIMAGKNAQRSGDFMVIARTEALIAGRGTEEALRRSEAYVKAGADAILIHSKAATADAIIEFMSRFGDRAPVVVVPTTYPDVTAQQLEAAGVRMVVYANHGLRAAVKAMEEAYERILHDGTSAGIEPDLAPLSDLLELQGMPQFQIDEAAYLRTDEPRTRAVILAAGDHMKADSMQQIAADVPLAMLDVNGVPLIERQVRVLREAGVAEITVVTGYRSDVVDVDGVTRVHNASWAHTGELASLMRVPDLDAGADVRTLVVYGDILFDREALRALLRAREDVVLLVNPLPANREPSDEKLLDLVRTSRSSSAQRRTLNATPTQLEQIGQCLSLEQADSEYTGLCLLSPSAIRTMRDVHAHAASSNGDGAFHEAACLDRASLTDMLQELVDRKQPVRCVEVSSGWLEIHSFEDYQRACRMVID